MENEKVVVEYLDKVDAMLNKLLLKNDLGEITPKETSYSVRIIKELLRVVSNEVEGSYPSVVLNKVFNEQLDLLSKEF